MLNPKDTIPVLLVDDERLFLGLLQQQLSRRGFQIATAVNGLEAIRYIEEKGPPLVISDWVMPTMDGLELCRRIRSSETIGFTYVILLTANNEPEAIAQAFEAGADDFMPKPFSEQELIARIKAAERIIRLESFYRANALHLHKINAEVSVMNGKLQRLTAELERARDEARAAQSFAERANVQRTELFASVSHEIRSPMTAILGSAELLKTDGDLSRAPPKRLAAVSAIMRNSEHLLEVINDLLDLSKLECGQLKVERIRCAPLQILEDIRTILEGRAAAKGLTLSTEYDGAIPETIETDPTRLRQILINLVSNGIKFTQTGHVRIVARLVEGGDRSPHMQFDVCDTGIGLSREEIARLFVPFEQARLSVARSHGGTGLGLFISRRFAEMLGGAIEVESRPGEGSRFRLTIDTGPLEGVTRLTGDDLHARTVPASPSSSPAPQSALAGRRILVVEDQNDIQQLLALYLQSAGAVVLTADNGKRAVETVTNAGSGDVPFDLVVMDIHMPVMDGWEAARRMRARGYAGRIIALSADLLDVENMKNDRTLFNGFAVKPISRDRLIETAEDALGAGEKTMKELSKGAVPLVSELAGDSDMVELVEQYVSELPHRTADLQARLTENDLEALAKLAHQLKGSAGGYGFPAITDAAMAVELSAKNHDAPDAIKQKLDELTDLCSRAVAKTT